MSNELQPLSLLFQNRLFRIPDYQRGYAWQQSQLVDFWDDLNNLQMDRYHYTGMLSLRLLSRKESDGWGEDLWMINKGYKPCHIVDGQQRLTTFIILLNEIIMFVRGLETNRDKSDNEIVLGDETLSEIISKYICQKRPPQGIITTYLFGYETDNPSDKYLRHRVFGEPFSGEISETYYTKNLRIAREFFNSNIASLYEEEHIEGIVQLYQKLTQKLMFNLHEIDDDYDVFVAFETMNNRGKRLTNLELLKNRLIYLTTIYDNSVIDGDEKAYLRREINDAWKEVYYQLGRNNKAALSDDDFLRAHWIIYFSYSRQRGDDYIKYLLNKFSAKNVFEKKPVVENDDAQQIYQDIVEDDGDDTGSDYNFEPDNNLPKLEPKEIHDYVNSLKEMANYWYESFFPYDSLVLSDAEKIWIDRLNRIGIAYFRPLVAVALCRCKDADKRISLFSAIERFIFVYFRFSSYRSNFQSSVYYNAARDIYNNEIDVQTVIDNLNNMTDSNFPYTIPDFINDIRKKMTTGKREGFYAWNGLKYFLFEYEYSLVERRGIKKISWELFTKSEKDMITIEHILPQTPTKLYWRNQFRQYIDNSQEMAVLTGSLGNLLPLSQSINSSLQNDSFDDKKNPQNGKRCGYTSGSNSELEVAKETEWNAHKIHARAVGLLDFLAARWDIPLSDEQKEELTYDDFIFEHREVPEVLSEEREETDGLTRREKRKEKRFAYWSDALPLIKESHGGSGHPFGNASPSKSNFIDGYFGVSGLHLYCSIGLKKNARCKAVVWIDTGSKETSKDLYDLLYSHKEDIESKVSMPIVWNRNDENIGCAIECVLDDLDFTDVEQWPAVMRFHAQMSKELADAVFYAYEPEIRALPYISTRKPRLTDYLSDVFRSWVGSKSYEGSVSFDPVHCDKYYTRFTTQTMSNLLPDADDNISGWNTRNIYFYEIRNCGGIFIQLVISTENAPDSLLDAVKRIDSVYHQMNNSNKWKLYFETKKFRFDEIPSEEEINTQLDLMFEEINRFETDLCDKLGLQDTEG